MMILAMLLAAGAADAATEETICITRHIATPATEVVRWLDGGAKTESPTDKGVHDDFTRAVDTCRARYRWSAPRTETAVRYTSAGFFYDVAMRPLGRRGITEAELAGYVATLDAAARTRIVTNRMVPSDVSAMVAFAQRAGIGVDRLDGAAGHEFGVYLGEAVSALINMQDTRAALARR